MQAKRQIQVADEALTITSAVVPEGVRVTAYDPGGSRVAPIYLVSGLEHESRDAVEMLMDHLEADLRLWRLMKAIQDADHAGAGEIAPAGLDQPDGAYSPTA